jgi:hypothetical protein
MFDWSVVSCVQLSPQEGLKPECRSRSAYLEVKHHWLVD